MGGQSYEDAFRKFKAEHPLESRPKIDSPAAALAVKTDPPQASPQASREGKPLPAPITKVGGNFSASLTPMRRITRAPIVEYDYPVDFPDADDVESEQILADREFNESMAVGCSHHEHERLHCKRVLRVSIAFAMRACKLKTPGPWRIVRIRSEVTDFLKAHVEASGMDWGRPELRATFEMTPEWKAYEDALLKPASGGGGVQEASLAGSAEPNGDAATPTQAAPLVDGHSNRSGPAKPIGQEATGVATPQAATAEVSWDAIEISFLSDERVQIRNGESTETRNYAELGFADGRVGKPNLSWETLRAMAEQKGMLQNGAKTGAAWAKVEKRMQSIRKALRNHFGITADPVPYIAGTGYRASFRIGCARSYNT